MGKNNYSSRAANKAENYTSDTKAAYKADLFWFHFSKSMITNGDLACLHGSHVLVYLVIKSHVNLDRCYAFLSHTTISSLSGVSVSQLKRCLDDLVEMGYMQIKPRPGKTNKYFFIEKFHCIDQTGRNNVIIEYLYQPLKNGDIHSKIKSFMKSGDRNHLENIENLKIKIVEESKQQCVKDVDIGIDKLPLEFQGSIRQMVERSRQKNIDK